MDDTFYHAFLSGEHTVLGETLKPFSLWHELCLEAIDSPLLGRPHECNVEDILIALRIFRTSFGEVVDLAPTFSDHLTRWKLKRSDKKLRKLVTILGHYIADNSSYPKFWKNNNGSKGGGLTCPPVLTTITGLTQQGFTESEAWNMSLGKARWYEATQLEREGAELRFLYEDELEDEAPDLNELTEEEIYQQARNDLGEAHAKIFMQKRKENQQC